MSQSPPLNKSSRKILNNLGLEEESVEDPMDESMENLDGGTENGEIFGENSNTGQENFQNLIGKAENFFKIIHNYKLALCINPVSPV